MKSEALTGKICKTGLSGFFGSSPGIFPGSEASEQQDTGRPVCNVVVLKNVFSVPLWTEAKDANQRTNVHSQPLPFMHFTASEQEALTHTKEDMSLATMGLLPGRGRCAGWLRAMLPTECHASRFL